jgi:hypothetical protein
MLRCVSARPSPARLKARACSAVAVPALVAGLLLTAAPAAHADRAPTRAETKAIKTAFLKGRSGATKIHRVRVSTVNKRFAAVTYGADIQARPAVARAAVAVKVPSPAILEKKKGGKWKVVLSAPKKVRTDLKAKARSELRISGDVTATFTKAASCTSSGGYYGASFYDRERDIKFSVQIHTWRGFRWYDALAVHSLAGIYVNRGTELKWETGQAGDAWAPSGAIFVDRGGWGIIDADLSHVIDGSGATGSVSVSGIWDCG